MRCKGRWACVRLVKLTMANTEYPRRTLSVRSNPKIIKSPTVSSSVNYKVKNRHSNIPKSHQDMLHHRHRSWHCTVARESWQETNAFEPEQARNYDDCLRHHKQSFKTAIDSDLFRERSANAHEILGVPYFHRARIQNQGLAVSFSGTELHFSNNRVMWGERPVRTTKGDSGPKIAVDTIARHVPTCLNDAVLWVRKFFTSNKYRI